MAGILCDLTPNGRWMGGSQAGVWGLHPGVTAAAEAPLGGSEGCRYLLWELGGWGAQTFIRRGVWAAWHLSRLLEEDSSNGGV